MDGSLIAKGCSDSGNAGTPSVLPSQDLGRRSTRPLRIVIVSGVRLVREGLFRSMCRRRDVVAAGLADFSQSQLMAIVDLRPDVSLVDVANLDGFVAARTLRSLDPAAKLVAFSVSALRESVLACAEAGFSGYVTREAQVADLVQAAHDAVAGRLTCTPQMAAAMFHQLSRVLAHHQLDDAASELTAREQQILSHLNQGCSNKEIARELHISPSTVKNHIHNVLQKLKVQRRGQAAALIRS